MRTLAMTEQEAAASPVCDVPSINNLVQAKENEIQVLQNRFLLHIASVRENKLSVFKSGEASHLQKGENKARYPTWRPEENKRDQP